MQNGLKSLFLLVLIVVFTGSLFAKERSGKMSFSMVGMNMDYREYSESGKILDSEKSDYADLLGFDLGYTFYFSQENNSYSQIDANFLFVEGKTDYVGALFGSNQAYGSYVGSTSNSIGDVDLTYRHTMIMNDSLELNYGLGVGYRYWLRSLSSTQEELYYWFSLRPSVGLSLEIIKGLHIRPQAEYQYGILPTMSETIFNHDFQLGSADIIELSLPVDYVVNETIDIFFEYVYQQQKITKSDVIQRNYNGSLSDIWEPDSTADNQYLKFGVTFKY